MAETTGIEWTDATFNPWVGCTKVSPGCDHCYAEARMDTRLHIVNWGPGAARKRTSVKNWKGPRDWNDEADSFEALYGRRRRVFCASLADVFDNEVPIEWLADLLDLIRQTPRLDWLLLTKRIGNVKKRLFEAGTAAGTNPEVSLMTGLWMGGEPPANVWLGASIVNQEEADRDIPKLQAIPARVRFLSMEPLLGLVDLRVRGFLPGVDWVIVGGESGHGARPMHINWVRHLRDQCAATGTPFLFKQWGEFRPFDGEQDKPLVRAEDPYPMVHVGKRRAGRTLDGCLHDGYPRREVAPA